MVVGTGLTATAASAATNASATPVRGLAGSPGGGDPNTTVTFAVNVGGLTMTAPASASLGSGNPGTTISGNLGGSVVVTDNRAALSATWTAVASSTGFTTGAASATETIPASDATYTPGAITTTGTVTATGTAITLSGTPQTVVTATGSGNSTASWDPTIAVAVPAAAVGGTYTGTLTQSVS
jgi:hypothetical protein